MNNPKFSTLFKQSFQDDQSKGSSQRFICYGAFLFLVVFSFIVLYSTQLPEAAETVVYTFGGLSVGGGLSSQIGKIKKSKT
jgi:uncharacterized membrane protein AbrB (regulator of aidB expression)